MGFSHWLRLWSSYVCVIILRHATNHQRFPFIHKIFSPGSNDQGGLSPDHKLFDLDLIFGSEAVQVDSVWPLTSVESWINRYRGTITMPDLRNWDKCRRFAPCYWFYSALLTVRIVVIFSFKVYGASFFVKDVFEYEAKLFRKKTKFYNTITNFFWFEKHGFWQENGMNSNRYRMNWG